MLLLVEIIKSTASLFLTALSLLIIIRVVYPLIADPEQSLLYSFAYATTQPCAQPVADFLENKLDMPVATDDLGAVIVLMIISLVRLFLLFFG